MLKDLQEKKALLKKDAEASKLERNQLNSEASQFATKRDELNTKTRTLIDQAQQYNTSATNTTYSFQRTKRDAKSSTKKLITCS